MFCSRCGNGLPESAGFCPACGAPVVRPEDPVPVVQTPNPRAPGRAMSPTASPAHPQHPLAFDVKRWGRGDFIVGGATLLLLIALFLPWFNVGAGGFGGIGFSVSALDAKGWMYLVFLVALATLGYLITRAMWDRTRLPLPHWQALTGTTGFSFLLTLLSFLTKPSGYSWAFGAYIGLFASVAAVAGSIIRRSEPEHLPVAPGMSVLQSANQTDRHFAPQPASQRSQPASPLPTPSGVESTTAGVAGSAPGSQPAFGTMPLASSSQPSPMNPETIDLAETAESVEVVSHRCTRCGQDNPANNKFCNACGNSFAVGPGSGPTD